MINFLRLLKQFTLISVLIYITNCYKSHNFNAQKLKQSAQQLNKNAEQSKQNYNNNGQTFDNLNEANSEVSNNNGTINSTIITLNQYTLELNQIPAYQQFLKQTTDQNLDIQSLLKQNQINNFTLKVFYQENQKIDQETIVQQIKSIIKQENFTIYEQFLQDKYVYAANLTLNKLQSVNLQLDFSSSYFIVKSYSCLDCTVKQVGQCLNDCLYQYSNANKYNCNFQNTQCTPLNKLASINYKGGLLRGYYIQSEIDTYPQKSQEKLLKIGNKIQFALCNTMQNIQWLLSDGILGFNYLQIYSDSSDKQYIQQGILSQLSQENKSNKKSFSLYLDFQNDNNFYNQQIEQNKLKLNDFGYYNFTQLDNEASTSNLIIGGYNSQYLNLQDFYYINLKNKLINQNETNNTSSQDQKDENKYKNLQQYELDAKLQSIIVDNQFEIKLEQNLDNQTIILDPNTFYSELTEEFIVQLIKILENTQGIHCFVGQYSKFLQCDYPYKKYDQYKNQFPDFSLKINDKQIYMKGKLFQGQCYNQTTGFKFDYIRQNTTNTQTTQNQKGNNTEEDASKISNNSTYSNNTDNSTQNNNTGIDITQNNNNQENDTIEQKHNFLKRDNNQIKKYQSNYKDDTIQYQNLNKIQENVAINSDEPINEKNKDKLISYKNYQYFVCYLNLRQSQNNDILLGRNFFYQYYTYFDLEQMKLGIKDISII